MGASLWAWMHETPSGVNTLILCLASPQQHLGPSGLYVKGFLLQRKRRTAMLGLGAKPGVRFPPLPQRSLNICEWWVLRLPHTRTIPHSFLKRREEERTSKLRT